MTGNFSSSFVSKVVDAQRDQELREIKLYSDTILILGCHRSNLTKNGRRQVCVSQPKLPLGNFEWTKQSVRRLTCRIGVENMT